MKQRQTLQIDKLCEELNRDITTLLNLAKSGKVPLWISFHGLDRYEAQPDGSINFVESTFELDLMPAPEVLNTLLNIQNNQSSILYIDDRIKQEDILTDIHKHPVFMNMEVPQTVINLDTTPYQIIEEDGKKKKILYNAFPALTTSGTLCIFKQRIGIIKKQWDDSGKEIEGKLQFYSNMPITIQVKDLFAYEDDASEYLRVLEKEFCVGRENLQEIFACSFNTVVTWVEKAGFEFERLDEGDPSSRPMLRYSDIEKVKEYKRLKKNKK